VLLDYAPHTQLWLHMYRGGLATVSTGAGHKADTRWALSHMETMHAGSHKRGRRNTAESRLQQKCSY